MYVAAVIVTAMDEHWLDDIFVAPANALFLIIMSSTLLPLRWNPEWLDKWPEAGTQKAAKEADYEKQ